MRRAASEVPLLFALLLSGCALPGPGHTPYGRMATVYPLGAIRGVQGELLAASDTIWLRAESTLYGRSARELAHVTLMKHRFGARSSFTALAIGGAATGVGMMLACNAYYGSPDASGSGGGCVGLVPGFAALFVVGGSIFALTNYFSATQAFSPTDARLPAFARFPQGLPDTVRKLRAIPGPPKLP